VHTVQQDGFLLDRGFQVFLTSYPEAKRWLDYDALELQPFLPGALVRVGNRFQRFVDPFRRPQDLLAVAFSSVATWADKLRVARLRRRVCHGSLEQLYQRPEQTTEDALREAGFSDRIVERFFRPFLGGVFLDRELATSSRMFEFVFRMFSVGDATLPATGMQAIPRQLAGGLSSGTVRLNQTVSRIESNGVQLTSGEMVRAKSVVLAADAPRASQLLPDQPFPRRQRGVGCLYFAADQPPVDEPILVLNGDGRGPINNLCVPSQVAPTYAPAGQSLISVTVLGNNDAHDNQVESAVRDQLRSWFGTTVNAWRHLHTDWIPAALPVQSPPALSPVIKPARVQDQLYVCGDHRHTASIQGAMESGRMTADAVLDARSDGR
jgi:phytoene dehydrogenase-like protein